MVSTTDQLLGQIISLQKATLTELEFIRMNTRATVSGLSSDENWSVSQFLQSLPGKSNMQVIPGETVNILSEEDSVGTLVAVSLTADSPYLSATVEVKSPSNTWLTIRWDSYDSFNYLGLTTPNPVSPYVSKWDQTNNIFTSIWTPDPGLFGFHNGIRASIENPQLNPTNHVPLETCNVIELLIIRKIFKGSQASQASQPLGSLSIEHLTRLSSLQQAHNLV